MNAFPASIPNITVARGTNSEETWNVWQLGYQAMDGVIGKSSPSIPYITGSAWHWVRIATVVEGSHSGGQGSGVWPANLEPSLPVPSSLHWHIPLLGTNFGPWRKSNRQRQSLTHQPVLLTVARKPGTLPAPSSLPSSRALPWHIGHKL